MFLQALLTILFLLLVYFLFHYKRIHYKFESAGLKYLPGIPIFGNLWKSTLLRVHFIHDLAEMYNAFPDDKYVGIADGIVPVILVRDPELIKTIVIKDFHHFQNRKHFFPERLDPLQGKNVLQLRDEEWKILRVKLSPAFTSARLRHMLPALIATSKNIVDFLKNYSSQDIELTECMYRYAGDGIMSAAFGLNQETAGRVDSIFFKFGSNLYLNTWRRVLIFISLQYPVLGNAIKNVIGLYVFPKESYDLIREAVSMALTYRKKHNLTIPDYMDVLKNISDGKKIDNLAGQVFFSYMANFEGGSSTLRFTFHELALHPEVQERLYQEIRKHEESEEMTVQSISGLKYLDCVLNEASRIWSAAIMMDRICTKTYTLPPPRDGGVPYVLQPGDMVFNVINPIHMDPQYHPNPEVFDPERFSDENKHKIKPFTYVPFGMGPRGCLGARFATLQMKVMIYYMILNFKQLKCKKTPDPAHLEPDEFNLKAVGGTWVHLEPRE